MKVVMKSVFFLFVFLLLLMMWASLLLLQSSTSFLIVAFLVFSNGLLLVVRLFAKWSNIVVKVLFFLHLSTWVITFDKFQQIFFSYLSRCVHFQFPFSFFLFPFRLEFKNFQKNLKGKHEMDKSLFTMSMMEFICLLVTTSNLLLFSLGFFLATLGTNSHTLTHHPCPLPAGGQ